MQAGCESAWRPLMESLIEEADDGISARGAERAHEQHRADG